MGGHASVVEVAHVVSSREGDGPMGQEGNQGNHGENSQDGQEGEAPYHEEVVALDRLEGALYCGVVALGHEVEVETNLLN